MPSLRGCISKFDQTRTTRNILITNQSSSHKSGALLDPKLNCELSFCEMLGTRIIGSLPSSKQRSKCKSMACKKTPNIVWYLPALLAGEPLSVCKPWGFQAASNWKFPFCLHLWMAKTPDFLVRSQERCGEGWACEDPAAPSGKTVRTVHEVSVGR